MSYQKFVQLSLVLVACVMCYSAAHPTIPKPRTVDLATALNNTVCPMQVHIDEELDRVPRRIKTLKCQENPHNWCEAHHIPQRECCAHHSNRHVMECVEVRDYVLVKYPKTGKSKIHEVSVGCTCLVSTAHDAATIAPPT